MNIYAVKELSPPPDISVDCFCHMLFVDASLRFLYTNISELFFNSLYTMGGIYHILCLDSVAPDQLGFCAV